MEYICGVQCLNESKGHSLFYHHCISLLGAGES